MSNRRTRRRWLAAVGAGVTAVLAGCGADDSPTETATIDAEPTGTERTTTPVDAQFTFDFVPESGLLLVTYAAGDPIPAGELEFGGPGETVTWAALSNRDPSEPVEAGGITQLGAGNAYDHPVSRDDEIPLYYTGDDGRVRLALWSGER